MKKLFLGFCICFMFLISSVAIIAEHSNNFQPNNSLVGITHDSSLIQEEQETEVTSPEELQKLLRTVIASKLFQDLQNESRSFEPWQWILIIVVGMLGGLLYGARNKQFILPHKNPEGKYNYHPGFLLDVFFGIAGGLVIYMIIPGDFDFSAGGFNTLKILAVTVIGGYGGRALIEKVYAEQVESINQKVRDLQAKDKNDAAALALVNKQLSPEPDSEPIDDAKIKKTISSSSSVARVEMFNLARAYRQDMWKKEKYDCLNKIVPIFEALIECDTENIYHRNHYELAYALKFMTSSEKNQYWKRAESEFSKAIEIRDKENVKGYRNYEFNRAICRIYFNESIDKIKSDLDQSFKSLDPVLLKLLKNPKEVREKEYLKWLQDNSTQLKNWIKKNIIAGI